MAKKWNKATKPKKLDETDDDGDSAVKLLGEYMTELEVWGKNVRIDIIRLEGAAGFSCGDPGDPPGGPFD